MQGRAKTVAPGVAPLVEDEMVTDAELLEAVIGHFADTLAASLHREILVGQLGLDWELAQRLRIGLSDRTLGLRLPDRRWKSGNVLRARLEAMGILRDSGHEAFRGCLVVPLSDRAGSVIGLFGRRTDRSAAVAWAHGLGGGIFEPAPNVASSGPLVVVGSIPDALAVLAARHDRVVAPARPKGFTKSDFTALAAQEGDIVVIGHAGAQIAESLARAGASVSLGGPDVGLAAALGASSDPPGALSTLLQTAHPIETSGRGHGREHGQPALATPGTNSNAVRVERRQGADELHVHSGARIWRIRGAAGRANVQGDALRVALMVSDSATGRFHLDTIDLYSARQRNGFVSAALSELHAQRDVVLVELAEVLAAAEAARDDAHHDADAVAVPMTDDERGEALEWLRDGDLLGRLRADLGSLGVVGEETNLLLGYLATISRLCERPFGILIQSSSAAGKSTLADALCSLVPPEDLVSLSALTSQALYYLGKADLSHKVLALAEEHGAASASYALKLLVSEGRLSIASTGKDRASGKLSTASYEIAGPVALVMTTTATEIDPELENRLVTLGVDEDAAQTRAIVEAQRRSATLEGLRARAGRDALRTRHANIGRLLEAFPVVIPGLDVAFPVYATRHRRDHAKVLSIVSALTLLHQHQREHKSTVVAGTTLTYLEATRADIETGVALAKAALVAPAEHLAPQSARLLRAFCDLATERAKELGCTPGDVALTRRTLREHLGWTDKAVRSGTDRLVALEYLVVAGGGRGRCRTYRYVDDGAHVGSAKEPVGPASGPVRPSEGRTEHGTATAPMSELAHLAHENAGQLEGPEGRAAYPKAEGSQ